MISISTLIVEDIKDTREIIKIAMENINESLTEIRFDVVGEADSFDSASFIIEREMETVGLVVLDIGLRGSKTGIDLIQAFPHLSYIIISSDPRASEKALNLTHNPRIHGARLKVQEDIPDILSIEEAIRKFIGDKKKLGGFFRQTLVIGEDKYPVWKIAIISKRPMKIDDESRIVECTDCHDYEKTDRVYYCTGLVNPTKTHSGCLHHSYVSKASMATLIEENLLDPKQFILISQSCIVNLKHVSHFDGNSRTFYIDIIDRSGKRSGMLSGLRNRLDEKTLYKIHNREAI